MSASLEIPFKKKTMLLYAAGALIFVALGLAFLVAALNSEKLTVGSVVFFGVGLSSVLFFGFAALVILPKIVGRQPGLIINDDGLMDNSSGVPAGFIPWRDIQKIGYYHSGSNQFLALSVKKPKAYIERERNVVKRLFMRMNYKMSGTPIQILVAFLDIDLATLSQIITDKHQQSKKTTG